MKTQEQQHLGIVGGLLMQMFGRPKGVLGRLGGIILARTKRDFTQWVIPLLEVQSDSKVLEVGFGPGVAIQILAATASTGSVAGIDYSQEMVEQATTRNAKAITAGIVQLHYGSVEKLPFADDTFDKALAINSMQVWSDETYRRPHRGHDCFPSTLAIVPRPQATTRLLVDTRWYWLFRISVYCFFSVHRTDESGDLSMVDRVSTSRLDTSAEPVGILPRRPLYPSVNWAMCVRDLAAS